MARLIFLLLIAVAVIALVRLYLRPRAPVAGKVTAQSPVLLVHDDTGITAAYPDGERRAVGWDSLSGIVVRTNEPGNWGASTYWDLYAGGTRPQLVYPAGATGSEALLETFRRRLRGFDESGVLTALASAQPRAVVVWERPRG